MTLFLLLSHTYHSLRTNSLMGSCTKISDLRRSKLSMAATGNSLLHDLKQTTARESHQVKTELWLKTCLLLQLSELQVRNSPETEQIKNQLSKFLLPLKVLVRMSESTFFSSRFNSWLVTSDGLPSLVLTYIKYTKYKYFSCEISHWLIL